MKRTLLLLLAALAIAFSCHKTPEPEPSEEPSEDISAEPSEEPSVEPSDEPSVPDDPMVIREVSSIWASQYADDAFTSKADIDYAKFFYNGEYTIALDRSASEGDCRFEFYGGDAMRFVSRADGYAVTLPREGLEIDYTLGKYGMQFSWPDARMRITLETVRPYSHDASGYGIYTGEWLDRYIDSKRYIDSNNMRYYKTTVRDDREFLPGYVTTIWSVEVRNPGDIEFPIYKVATIRRDGQYGNFGLIVYKSRTYDDAAFEAIAKSFRSFTARGTSRHYVHAATSSDDPHWNEATRRYYHKLIDQKTLDFGAFTYAIPYDGQDTYDYYHPRLTSELERLQGAEGLAHDFEILPTYCHIRWYSTYHYFPVGLASELAGGDGFNGKPVLQFTYQFTTDNNNVSSSNPNGVNTPMWDILRGKYDDHFRTLAENIRDYGAPVIFRLNNEMNSDWTSYCGMMTLIDPEIFVLTWRRLYDIFMENGVDNAIWQFNPIAVSCPYSNWGEDLSYYPGNDYVHLLGLTSYEMNNSGSPASFRSLYTSLYDKNKVVFSDLPAIIGEFACGAGGETSGALKRNGGSQAEWVRVMFDDFCDREANPYLANIKGAVWFSCNDYDGDGRIINQLSLDSDLTGTLAAFRDGFVRLSATE